MSEDKQTERQEQLNRLERTSEFVTDLAIWYFTEANWKEVLASILVTGSFILAFAYFFPMLTLLLVTLFVTYAIYFIWHGYYYGTFAQKFLFKFIWNMIKSKVNL